MPSAVTAAATGGGGTTPNSHDIALEQLAANAFSEDLTDFYEKRETGQKKTPIYLHLLQPILFPRRRPAVMMSASCSILQRRLLLPHCSPLTLSLPFLLHPKNHCRLPLMQHHPPLRRNPHLSLMMHHPHPH